MGLLRQDSVLIDSQKESRADMKRLVHPPEVNQV